MIAEASLPIPTWSMQQMRGLLLRLIALLLIATIALQAASLTSSTQIRQSGSAFSALTLEVTLAPRQQERILQVAASLPDPFPADPPIPTGLEPIPAASIPTVHNSGLGQSTSSPRDRPETPILPRAPPRS